MIVCDICEKEELKENCHSLTLSECTIDGVPTITYNIWKICPKCLHKFYKFCGDDVEEEFDD